MAVTNSKVPYIGQALPAKQVWVSGTTLFHVAARELGDAEQWYRIAQLNGLTDPWIGAAVLLSLPPKGSSNGGILDG